ncbi:MAG: GNAT family N-acetyltransferase [Acidobacteriota bacterium]
MKAIIDTSSIRISLLADFPQFVPTIARLLLEHWRFALPDDTYDARVERLHGHLNKVRLPVALVAHTSDKFVGTVSLRTHELDDRADLSPWLGGLYVLEAFRNRGIGQALCEATEDLARKQNASTLHLFTLDKQAWYEHQKWRVIDQCLWQGRKGVVMYKHVGPDGQ